MFDYHVHSAFSDDSWYEMEQVVKDAISLGLKEICFTDHVDYGVKLDHGDLGIPRMYEGKEVRNVDYERYFNEIAVLQKKYQKDLVIKKGLEFGIQRHTVENYQRLYKKYPMDFILLSIHQINNQEFWTGEFQKGKSDLACYEEYYAEMYQVIQQFSGYSCLAHMDLIRRYLDKERDMFEKTQESIRMILNYLIEQGKGIEVNTSSDRYGVNGSTPSIHILKLYYELGGEILTIGSDSHKKEDLGYGIRQSKKLLKEVGFNYYCTFDAMKPTFHRLT